MDKLKNIEQKLCDELEKIGAGPITAQNLEAVVKLATVLEKCKKAEYYDGDTEGEEYSERRGRSRTTGRYVSRDGRYSGNDYMHGDSYGMDERLGRYMDSKSSYRYSRTGNDKQQMLNDLSEMMDGLTEKLESMCRDTDCAEEIETMQRYINRLKAIK